MLIHIKHAFLFSLKNHNNISDFNESCLHRIRPVSLSHWAESSSCSTHEAFLAPKGLTWPHYLQWKQVEAHQLKLGFVWCQTLYNYGIIESQNSPGWTGPQKISLSNLSWEREPSWEAYLLSFISQPNSWCSASHVGAVMAPASYYSKDL